MDVRALVIVPPAEDSEYPTTFPTGLLSRPKLGALFAICSLEGGTGSGPEA